MISYAAEGASFTDRKKYPNFFATVGDNRQYEQVYVELFQRMDWKRVVALSEDGQKYTEYISQMEHLPKDKLIELKNKKFPKSFTDDKMKKVLSCIYWDANLNFINFLLFFLVLARVKREVFQYHYCGYLR